VDVNVVAVEVVVDVAALACPCPAVPRNNSSSSSKTASEKRHANGHALLLAHENTVQRGSGEENKVSASVGHEEGKQWWLLLVI
jgi:hypothetical protein